MDASDTGIAGKLNQIEPSSDVQDESNITPTPKERLIACISRSLSKQERKWAAHEKEALAVIWSLEKFRTYLCDAEFTIYTDHRNLLWLLNLDADKGRLSRWATLMAPWQIKAVTPKELKEGKIEQHGSRTTSYQSDEPPWLGEARPARPATAPKLGPARQIPAPKLPCRYKKTPDTVLHVRTRFF